MCGGCGGRSTAVRVARNTSKKTSKKTSNGVIVMRHRSVKKKSKPINLSKIGTPRIPGVRVARNKAK